MGQLADTRVGEMMVTLEKTQYHWVSRGKKIPLAPIKLKNATTNYTLII